MALLHISKDNFQKEVVESSKTVLLDFWATWCGPCQMLTPILEQISNENPNIVIGKIDVDQDPGLASQFGVQSIPKLVVIKNGKVVAESVGYRPKDKVLELLERA